MNIKQKALVERAIKIRYNGLIQSLETTKTVVEKEFARLEMSVYEPSGDSAELPAPLKREYTALVKSIETFEENLKAENDRRHAVREEARRKRHAVIDALRRERDERIIAVAFEGEEKEVVAQLHQLPTAKQVAGRLGTLKLTGELADNAGIGDENPSALNVE